MNDRLRFGELLTEFIERQGTTHGKLAGRTDVARKTIFNWATSISVPRLNRLADVVTLAQELRLSRAELTEWLAAAELPLPPATFDALPARQQADLPARWLTAAAPSPFQAPARLPYFIGRTDELTHLTSRIRRAADASNIYALVGMGGVGKSALAVQLAYALRDDFPDGVLWAQLDLSPPMAALAGFAAAYGRDVSRYTDLGTRAGAVRDLLAHKRALVILDNADNSRQLQHLLPPSTGHTVVIVTTRRRDLALTYAVNRVELQPFGDSDTALDLFRRLLGERRVAQDAAALRAIAALLGHLPLALAIAAGRLAYEPDWSTADFHDWVAGRRLGALDNEVQSVRLSFDASYTALTPETQAFFDALGVFGGEDFTPAAAAAVSALPSVDVHEYIRRLHKLSLLQRGRTGRYRLHPLLRAYAHDHGVADGVAARMVAYYVDLARRHSHDPAALALDDLNILHALDHAVAHGPADAVPTGVAAFYPYLRLRGLYDTAGRLLADAERIARARGDDHALAQVACQQGNMAWRLGQRESAESRLRLALQHANQSEVPETLVDVLNNLGGLALSAGQLDDADGWFRRALEIARASENPAQTCGLYANLGMLEARRGRFTEARAYLETGVELARAGAHLTTLCGLLSTLGWVSAESNRPTAAERAFLEGLAVARQTNQQERAAELLANLGVLATLQQQYDRAVAYLDEALTIARAIHFVRRVSHIQGNLGATLARAGDIPRSEAYFADGLAQARALADQYLVADILYEWGTACLEQARYADAAARLGECVALAEAAPFHALQRKARAALARLPEGGAAG